MATNSTAIATEVVTPAIIIMRRSRAINWACSGDDGSGARVEFMDISASHPSGVMTVTVAGDEGSPRLDRVLAARLPELSRSRLKALILAGHVSIGGHTVRDPALHVASGATITVAVPPAIAPEPEGEPIPLDIIYE